MTSTSGESPKTRPRWIVKDQLLILPSYYNKTQYSGLENNVPNSYANSLLQVMHYTPLIRNLALQHAASACLVDPCLLCEIGFVFDMLEKAEGTTCQATNMLKALSSLPQGNSAFQLLPVRA